MFYVSLLYFSHRVDEKEEKEGFFLFFYKMLKTFTADFLLILTFGVLPEDTNSKS